MALVGGEGTGHCHVSVYDTVRCTQRVLLLAPSPKRDVGNDHLTRLGFRSLFSRQRGVGFGVHMTWERLSPIHRHVSIASSTRGGSGSGMACCPESCTAFPLRRAWLWTIDCSTVLRTLSGLLGGDSTLSGTSLRGRRQMGRRGFPSLTAWVNTPLYRHYLALHLVRLKKMVPLRHML